MHAVASVRIGGDNDLVIKPRPRAIAMVWNVIESKRDEVSALCERCGVRRLALFGSATRDDFDAERSDLDFLVEFEEMPPGEYVDAYFSLLEGLGELFSRRVDLVTNSSVENPYFREGIEETRTDLYAA